MEDAHLSTQVLCHFIHLKLFWILSKWLLSLDGDRAVGHTSEAWRALGLESREEGKKERASLELSQGPDGLLDQDTEVKSVSTCFPQTGVFGAE